jgi:hypothetical protein
MWASGTEDRGAWQKVADQVTAKHPNIKIQLEAAPFDDYFIKLGTDFGSSLTAELAPSPIPVQPEEPHVSSLGRRSLIGSAAPAGGAVAFGLPQTLWPTGAHA